MKRVLVPVGKLLISVGMGVLLFVVWTLWGTGIGTNRAQNRLSEEFDAHGPFDASANDRGRPPQPPRNFAPDAGDPVFRIKIPAINLHDGKGFIVVEGVDQEQLALGPGHYPECRPTLSVELCTEQPEVWPGERGRMIVSGHRTTHSFPFLNLDRLDEGDDILLQTWWGDFTYVVTKLRIVDDQTTEIVNPTATRRAQLVLTTCNPKHSSAERLLVFAELSEWGPPAAGRKPATNGN
ncbi:MAG: sortase [Actinomycetota bacterium]|nr:sortase [Actinomycetota bacterium]